MGYLDATNRRTSYGPFGSCPACIQEETGGARDLKLLEKGGMSKLDQSVIQGVVKRF